MVVGATALVLWLATQVAPACERTTAEVEHAIAAKARELRSVELCEGRRSVQLDVAGERHLVFLLSFEPRDGSNRSQHFLAAFPLKAQRAPAMALVGTRGVRLPKSLRLEEGKIVVETQDYGPDDAMCCPSKPGQLVFGLRDGKVVDETMRLPLGLSKQEIAGVSKGNAGWSACYAAWLKKNPGRSARLDLDFTITENGMVVGSKVVSSSFADDDTTSCLLLEFRRWRFPQSARPTTVKAFSFAFAPNNSAVVEAERIEGGLSFKDVSSAIKAQRAPAGDCLADWLPRHPGIPGTVDLSLSIAKDGNVARAVVTRSTLGDESATACVLATALRWKFPRAPRPTLVRSYPLTYEQWVDKGNLRGLE